jgi:hypothetical protein
MKGPVPEHKKDSRTWSGQGCGPHPQTWASVSPLSHTCIHTTPVGRGHPSLLMGVPGEVIISNNGFQQKRAIFTMQKSSSSFRSKAEWRQK